MQIYFIDHLLDWGKFKSASYLSYGVCIEQLKQDNWAPFTNMVGLEYQHG